MTDKINTEGLRYALNLIDRVIGKEYRNLAVLVDSTKTMVRITGDCRVCKAMSWAEENATEAGYGEALVKNFIDECEKHAATHKIIIARH
jgi:hypothetical protein